MFSKQKYWKEICGPRKNKEFLFLNWNAGEFENSADTVFDSFIHLFICLLKYFCPTSLHSQVHKAVKSKYIVMQALFDCFRFLSCSSPDPKL